MPCSWTQYSAAGEAQTHNPRIWSQEHYNWAGNCTPYKMLSLIWTKAVYTLMYVICMTSKRFFKELISKKNSRQQNASIIN